MYVEVVFFDPIAEAVVRVYRSMYASSYAERLLVDAEVRHFRQVSACVEHVDCAVRSRCADARLAVGTEA